MQVVISSAWLVVIRISFIFDCGCFNVLKEHLNSAVLESGSSRSAGSHKATSGAQFTNELALLERGFSLATASPKGFEALGDYISAVEEAPGGELLEGTLVTR